uniref:Rhodopsin domain-containing protein n=1 Tax=Talaromyces marneffei PM1 TaxID=1077442 RepID=A0A093VHN4_TALMA
MAQDSTQDRGTVILVAMWTTTSIATIFVAARLYTRAKIVRSLGLDDYLISMSILLGLLFVSLTTASVRAGDGRHADSLTSHAFERAALLNTAGFAPGILSFVIPKLGVVALLCRIFNPTQRWKIFLWSFVGGGGLLICGCIIIIYAQCNPTKALWTGVGNCWNPGILVDYSIFAGALSAVIDIFLAIYPAVILWRLQLPLRRKVLLLAAFALGAWTSGRIRFHLQHLGACNLDKVMTSIGSRRILLLTFFSAESNAVIIAACIPTIIPLIETLFFKRNAKSFQIGAEHEMWAPTAPSRGRPALSPFWKINVDGSRQIRRPNDNTHNQISVNEIRRTDEISIFID